MSQSSSLLSIGHDADKPKLRSGPTVLRGQADDHSAQQQPARQPVALTPAHEASDFDVQSDSEEIFPAAVLILDGEAAARSASGELMSHDVDSAAAAVDGAVADGAQQQAREHAAASSMCDQATVDTVPAVNADESVLSRPADEDVDTVSDIIKHAAASTTGRERAQDSGALWVSSQVTGVEAAWQTSTQPKPWDLTAAHAAHEQYGREYPWMQDKIKSAIVNSTEEADDLEAEACSSAMRHPHVSFAAGAMARGQGSKIPMRFLAAAASDTQAAAEEAAASAVAAATARSRAAALASANINTQTEGEAAGAAAVPEETVINPVRQTVLEDVVVSQAGGGDVTEQVRQAAEQEWPQDKPLAEPVHNSPAMPLWLGSHLPSTQGGPFDLIPPEGDASGRNSAMGHDSGNAARVHQDSAENDDHHDAASVASYANSAASGLGHLMRAQQPWSESSSSSPDRTSTTGSAHAKDISQLQAEVISQPGTEQQLPRQLLLPAQHAAQHDGADHQMEWHQSPLPSVQEQSQSAQHAQQSWSQRQPASQLYEECKDGHQPEVWQGAERAGLQPGDLPDSEELPRMLSVGGQFSAVQHDAGKIAYWHWPRVHCCSLLHVSVPNCCRPGSML